ncbi:MAG: acetate/propionate family kinase [Burkholderiales bacterium]|nr:acetate/propionate family kinase [Burkholderiales bacterium]
MSAAATARHALADGTILSLNAGSSSLKFALYRTAGGALTPTLRGQLEGLGVSPRFVARAAGRVVADEKLPPGTLDHQSALDYLLAFLDRQFTGLTLTAVGHRVVHGGAEFMLPVRADAALVAALDRLVPLAPLHQSHTLAPIRVLLERLPDVPQVVCFDTAFHRTQPAVARTFALPRELTARGIVRYGFHGLSYEYIAQALPALDARAAAGRTVVLHLGNGASMCALAAGRSAATTMGFTTVDGLPMGTRCGALDPGVLLYCMTELRMDAAAVERLIYQQSGLLGVSGVSSDMRTLEASADPHAREAIELFVYRIGCDLGALAAALGGLDAIVFTAGIGEHSVALRERVCRAAAWLGVELDAEANARHGARISTADSRTSAWVVPTDEELMIAQHAQAYLATR